MWGGWLDDLLAKLLWSLELLEPEQSLSLSFSLLLFPYLFLLRREFLLISSAGVLGAIIVSSPVYIRVVITAVIYLPVGLSGGAVETSSVFLVFSLTRGLLLSVFVSISRTLLEASHTRVALTRLQVRPSTDSPTRQLLGLGWWCSELTGASLSWQSCCA